MGVGFPWYNVIQATKVMATGLALSYARGMGVGKRS
jgi:hypothetical protein